MLATALATALAAMLCACDGPGVDRDAGDDDAALGGALLVRLGTREDALPAEWQLDDVSASFSELRIDNDRGGELEPVLRGVEWMDEERITLRLEGVPATYGGVTLQATAFEIAFSVREAEVRVVSARELDVSARCTEGAVRLRPGEQLTLEVLFDVAPLAARLAADLGEPAGETIVDASTAPSLLEAIEALFVSAWSVSCEGGA